MSNTSTRVLYKDTYFGESGGGSWLVPIGAIGCVYSIHVLYSGGIVMLDRERIGVALFLFALVLLLLVALAVAIIFIFQAVSTLQKVEVGDDGLCEGMTYYGKRVDFSLDDVADVRRDKVIFFKSFKIPLGRNSDYFKVLLTSGNDFYISAAMSNVDELINRIKSEYLTKR